MDSLLNQQINQLFVYLIQFHLIPQKHQKQQQCYQKLNKQLHFLIESLQQHQYKFHYQQEYNQMEILIQWQQLLVLLQCSKQFKFHNCQTFEKEVLIVVGEQEEEIYLKLKALDKLINKEDKNTNCTNLAQSSFTIILQLIIISIINNSFLQMQNYNIQIYCLSIENIFQQQQFQIYIILHCNYYLDKFYKMPIIIKPISATLSQDRDFFSKQDPYAVFTYGSQQKKSAIDKGAGKTPTWTDTFVFNNVRDVIMKVEVWDSDTFYDDLIGQGIFNLAKILNNPNHIENQYVDLMRKGQCRGRILVSMQYQIPYPTYPNMPNYSNMSENQRFQQNHQINNPQMQINPRSTFPGYFSQFRGTNAPIRSYYPQSQMMPNRFSQPNISPSQIKNPVEGQYKIIIRPLEAHMLKDADTFSKMDPFCQIEIGKNIQRTETQQNVGKNPVFSEQFVFLLKSSYMMKIGIFDEDVLSNEHCGQASLDLRPYLTELDVPSKVELTLKKGGKQTGKILFSIEAQLSHY